MARSERARSPLPPGTVAPKFILPATPHRNVSLDEHRGAPLVLIFYPADFSPVCTDELAVFNELVPDFRQLGAAALGISVDNVWSHLAWARERHLRLPLLSDFHPKGDVARRYEVWREDLGVAARALYVIDGEGRIFWSLLSPLDTNPGADGVLDALERLAASRPQTEAMP